MSSKNTQQYFICPITLELFNDPVTAQDGITYERKAITQWINQHHASPITKKPLDINQLIPNNAIKDTIKAFKEKNAHSAQGENLDVLCLFCGSTQKVNSIQEHKSQCSSKPANIEPFEIADNEIDFVLSQQSSSKRKSSRSGKTVSFQNPLTHRTANPTPNNNSIQIPIAHDTRNKTNVQMAANHPCSRFTNRQKRCFLIILSVIILSIITITLTVYYTQSNVEPFSTGVMITPTLDSTTTSTFTSTSISSSPTTSTSASSSTLTTTSASSSPFTTTSASSSTLSTTYTSTFPCVSLCAAAEWDRNATTIASDLYDPHDIAFDSENNIIIADTENHLLQKQFPNGTRITLVTDTKIPSVFVDKCDNIYFTDAFADAVMELSSDDQLIRTVAGGNGLGSALDQLNLSGLPGIYVDQNFTLYISDIGNHRVIKYVRNSTSGIVVAGGHGQGPELNQLNTPHGVYVDEIIEIGAIYICDSQNHRIQKWLPGASQGITVAVNEDQLHSPISILLESTSDQMMIMYISSFSLNKVFKWIPYAEKAESVVAGKSNEFGTDPDELFAPTGIRFDKDWNLFVADTGNNRIQKFLFNTSSCLI